MRGTVQNKVDREAQFNNEFDQFVAEPEETLVSVYNRFAQLMNDLERNGIKFAKVTVNTMFLNCLQPEWLKYVTQVCLAKRLTEDSYDDLFDYLSQYEKVVNPSRANKLEKSHDPLALVAHTGSSSRIPSPYYVTHPYLVVDYDDDYQGDAFQNNYEDPLTYAMMLLARSITQRFFNPTNNRLCTSSNTRNQAIVQADRVNIQSRNSGNDGRNTRRSYVQEEIIEGNNVQNDAGNTQRIIQTTSSGSAANVQCYNCSEKGPSYDSAFLSEVQQPSPVMRIHYLLKIIKNKNVNSGRVEYDNNVQASYELEQLGRNAYKEVEKQQIKRNATSTKNLQNNIHKMTWYVL
ncbi:hypothetical protein Tco_0295244 [Tanacetum coccineum]